MADVSPIPAAYRTLTPHLVVRGGRDALEYYAAAFGAEVLESMPGPDGSSIMNATLKIGDSVVMIADEMPMMTYWVSPDQLEGTTSGVHLFVEDVDAWFKRANDAGLRRVMMEPQDTFWGDRYCQFIDRFGHAWSIATRKENLTPEQIQERAKEWMARRGNPSYE